MDTEKKRFPQEIKYICGISICLFIALSLATYDPLDPSLNSIGVRHQANNFGGLVGSFLADLLYQGFGLGSWYLVFLIIAPIAHLVFSSNKQSTKVSWLLHFGFLLNLSALISIYFSDTRLFNSQITPGGTVGMLLSKSLLSSLNTGGLQLLLWTGLLIQFLVITKLSVQEIFLKTQQKGLPQRAVRGLSGLLLRWSSQLVLKIRTDIQKMVQRPKKLFVRAKSRSTTSVPGTFLPLEDPQRAGPAAQAEEETEVLSFGKEASIPDNYAVDSSYLNEEGSSGGKRRIIKPIATPKRIANWVMPKIDLLEDPPFTRVRVDEREIRRKGELLLDKLKQFGVGGTIVAAKPGPAVTMYELKPNADVKISKITELADDLALALSSESLRIVAPIPGRDVVGVETSNSQRETVFLKDILGEKSFWSDEMKLPLALGKQANGDNRIVDLRKMPHLLVAGTTGSGKSVFTVAAITGLLLKHSPKTLKLILIDPKQVDLAAFSEVPHLISPTVTDPKKAVGILRWAVREMEKRYRSMKKFSARGLEAFNETVENLSPDEIEAHTQESTELGPQHDYYFQPQPYIVIVCEEFGDLMAVDKQNVEQNVVRLAQMARACGIHLLLAMQSPRKEVVTGLIKTNIPGRISFKVASKMDSRIILDEMGAERLLAQGDMLFLSPGFSKPMRHHGPFLKESEIQAVAEFWSDQGGPDFDPLAQKIVEGRDAGDSAAGDGALAAFEMEESEHDEKYDEILAWTAELKEVSASLIQRRFRLGYPRAARLIEIFEKEGVVGPANGSKPRLVLVQSHRDL